MQIVVAAVPGQEAITRDNVTLKVDAVVYYRVIDALKAIINVQNYTYAVSQVAQTSLRSVIGQSDIDHILSERDKINAHLKDVIPPRSASPVSSRATAPSSLARPPARTPSRPPPADAATARGP
jgi:regulator of protease activity HflC (stomatin/prohibitin superfamily)